MKNPKLTVTTNYFSIKDSYTIEVAQDCGAPTIVIELAEGIRHGSVASKEDLENFALDILLFLKNIK